MADEANDVNTPVEAQVTTTTESSPAENNAPEVAYSPLDAWDDQPKEEPKQETEDKPKEAEENTEAEPEKPADETEAEEEPRGKKDANTRIRQLVGEKRELEQKIERLNTQVYKPQTPEELVEDGLDETRALVESMRQEREVERFNSQVTELNTTLDHESTKVLDDFPVFDPDSKEYNEAFATRVGALYQRAANMQTDPHTGLIINASLTPYEFYKEFADSRSEALKTGELNGKIAGQKSTAQMLASAEAPSSAAPRTTNKTELMELWAT
jgi:hypothetical protein